MAAESSSSVGHTIIQELLILNSTKEAASPYRGLPCPLPLKKSPANSVFLKSVCELHLP